VVKSENKICFSKTGSNSVYFVVCKAPLNCFGEGSFWKVTIDALPDPQNDGWVHLGIIRNLNASLGSCRDLTSYGWAGGSQVYREGREMRGSGWTQFSTGECLYFHLAANKLTMYSVQKNKQYFINIATSVDYVYHIHFNLYQIGTKLTLEPLSVGERERLL